MELTELKDKIESILHVEIDTKNSSRHIVDARRIFTLIAFKNTKPKLIEVGDILKKGHAMTIHYRKTGRDLLEVNKSFQAKYNRVLNQLKTIKSN